MSFSATVYKVMIASPSDVPEERDIIREVVHEWNAVHGEHHRAVLIPVGWETHSSPAMGDRAQEIINKQVLGDCDLLIAAFWTRLGSPTGKAASGTVEEIEEHLATGKPAMLYFSSAPVRLESVDEKQYKALEKFKKECLAKGLIDTYDSTAEFRQKLVRQLAQTMLRDVLAAKGVEELPPQRQPPLPALCDEAKQLLLETEQDDHGTALKTLSSGGFCVQANGKILIDTRDPRARARWEEAFQQLEENDLLRDRGYKGEVFGMTAAGYEMAALLREGQK